MAVPTDMDGFSDKIGTTDTYSRLSLGDALLNYLGNTANSIECSDIGQFIDKLVPWLTSSNFKVAQKGLETMTALIERMRSDFKPYVPTVIHAIVDRLGDSHESVREKSQAGLMIILEKEVLTPQQLFDRLVPAFSHKNSKVREEVMITLVNTVNLYGSNSIALSKLTPHLVKLLADQNMHVRDQAFNTLIEIYRHIGDKLRVDIQRRYASTINPSRLAPLMAKMEELRDSGAVLPLSTKEGRYEDETDRPQRSATKKSTVKKPPVIPLSSTPLVPGAVDEEYFINAFEEVPTVQIFSGHELKEMVNSIAAIISNSDADWDKRVDAFKKIRSLLIAGAASFDDFNELIKKLELPFMESLKDLRSHVVRETCVTIAYLAQTLCIKFGHFSEVVFPSLTTLIQSSAKVIASSAFTAIRFIIQNVHHPRLLPIINSNLASRSKEIRKAMCDVLDQLIHTWPLSILDRRIPLLQEAVRKGVSDADLDARISARRAYWAFKGHFPEQADALLSTLDYAYKRNLYGDVSLSGSNQSLNQGSFSMARQITAPAPVGRNRGANSASGRNLALVRKHSTLSSTCLSSDIPLKPVPVDQQVPRTAPSALISTTEKIRRGKRPSKLLQPRPNKQIMKKPTDRNQEKPSTLKDQMTMTDVVARREQAVETQEVMQKQIKKNTAKSQKKREASVQVSPKLDEQPRSSSITQMPKEPQLPKTSAPPEVTPSLLTMQQILQEILRNLSVAMSAHVKEAVPEKYAVADSSQVVEEEIKVLRPVTPLFSLKKTSKVTSFGAGYSEQTLLVNRFTGMCRVSDVLGSNLSEPKQVETRGHPGLESRDLDKKKLPVSMESVPVPNKPAEKKVISPGNRSNSAIDLQAAQRANARAQYAAMTRMKAGSGASLRDDQSCSSPRSRKSPEVSAISSPERVSRPRSRVSGYSQSQPTSRSASPSSHLSYHTYQSPTSRPRKLSGSGISGIPGPRSSTNSRETSRETSPTRHGISKLRSRGMPHMSSFDRPPSAKPVMTQKILQQSREAESALADALTFEDGQGEARALNSRKSCKLFDDHSDDSETSSVCSERSFDSLRRPSDSYSWSGSQNRIYKDPWNESSCKDITEIIANCSRSSWSDRKEGLVGLNQYLQNGNLLTPLELKRVTEIFTKMFMDSQTKVFTLFLDTLNEIIIRHQADLNDWLYILLTKLLNKLGSDVLTSIGRKIQNTLALVREHFSTELQMNEMLRFIVDPTQTHNTKVKVAALNYLAQLASEMEPSDFNPGSCGGRDPTAPALAKMINWTKSCDTKGTGEVKRASQEAIIALFNLNTSIITMKLAELSKEHQELAANLVQSHLRHSSSGGSGGSAPSSPAPMPLSPSRPSLPNIKNNHYEGDAIDSDEIYKSLRRTTAEIQNYSFESKLVERDRDTTSQDSGISQMSAGPGDKMEALEERMETFSLQGNNSGHSSSLSSPTQRISLREYNGMEKTLTSDSLDEQDGYQEGSVEEEGEAWKSVLQTLGAVDGEPLTSQQKEALTLLFRLVRQGSTLTLTQNFRKLFKILVQLLPLIDTTQSNKVISDVAVITQVLRTITEMFKKPALTPLFADFTELLLMKVMRLFEGAHKENKEVVRHAETCCSAMATVLPVDTTLKMLNAFAHTKEHPVNMYAVKTITKVVQHRSKEQIYPHLKPTMTALIEAYNSEYSSVRKSVVFCIVAFHGVFGEEELAPYLDKLCPSKRKLLNLYIKRQQQGTSTPPNESKNNTEKDSAPGL